MPESKRHTVVIDVSGGVVQAVFSDLTNEELDVILVNWDNVREGDRGFLFAHALLTQMHEDTAEEVTAAFEERETHKATDPPHPEWETYQFTGPGDDDAWWVRAPGPEAALKFIAARRVPWTDGPTQISTEKFRYDTAHCGLDAVADADGNPLWQAKTVVW